MELMTEDCVFEAGRGPERFGTRYQGQDAVRERFIAVWTDIPDVKFKNATHFADGDRGCTEWTLVGTTKEGTEIDVDGCDLFTFENGKIKSKRTYIKNH